MWQIYFGSHFQVRQLWYLNFIAKKNFALFVSEECLYRLCKMLWSFNENLTICTFMKTNINLESATVCNGWRYLSFSATSLNFLMLEFWSLHEFTCTSKFVRTWSVFENSSIFYPILHYCIYDVLSLFSILLTSCLKYVFIFRVLFGLSNLGSGIGMRFIAS